MKSVKNSIRSTARNIFLSVAGTFRRPAPCVVILNGHMISRGKDTDSAGERFGELLKKLSAFCDFVDIGKAIEMIENREHVGRTTVAFTFDDGWADCYTQIAPQLDKIGVNAMFFINPNFADALEAGDEDYIRNFTENTTDSPGKRPMSWNQMRELLGKGYLFGAHTLDHYCINAGGDDELRHQIVDCRRIMEERLGVECPWFAFPYGRLEHASKKSIDIACETYRYVFSQSDYKHYFSFGGRVINRRHFEPFWPVSHVKYFLSAKRK